MFEDLVHGMRAGRLALAALPLLALGACGEPEWFAVVYPNANNKQNSRVLGSYKTLEACRTAIEQEFYEVRLGGAGGPRMAWECHSQCSNRTEGRPEDGVECKRIEPGLV